MATKKHPEPVTEPLIPFQVKSRPEVREKLKLIAKQNGLSLNDVASMALAAGMNMVEAKLREIHEPAKAA
jgi:predicted HicB family RNase H-like nuclease